jgi:general secretion pathway protein H
MVRTLTSRAGSESGDQGFTLLELVVVLLVMSLALVVVTQSLRRPSPELELKLAAATVASAFREARSLAIRDNREMPVTVDLDAHTVRIGTPDADRSLGSDLGISLHTATSEMAGKGVGSIRFFPDGTSTGGRVTLFANAQKYDVSVDWLTGWVGIQH